LPAVKPTIAFTFTQQKHRIHREKGPVDFTSPCVEYDANLPWEERSS